MRFLIKYIFMAVLISMATVFYLLGFTTEGLSLDLRYASAFLPGTFTVEKVNGTLLSGFSLEKVRFQTKEQNITLQSLMLTWYPKQLLQGKFAINSLVIEQPQITLLASDSAPSDFSFDDLTFLRHITMNRLVIHQLDLKKQDVQLMLTGELNDSWNFNWKLSIPKLKTLCTTCTGSFSGSGSIVGKRFVPTIDAMILGNQLVLDDQKIGKLKGNAHIVVKPKTNSTIHLSASQLKINDNTINPISLTLSANMAYEKKTLLAAAQISLSQKTSILLNAALPDFSSLMDPNQKIIASAKVNLTDLTSVAYFIPVIQHPRGLIQGVININGKLSKPDVTGTLNLTQGHVAIHDLGIHLNDMMVQAILDKSKKISLQGHFRSAKGTGKLEGTVDASDPLFPLALTVIGNNLNAVHIPKFKIAISPDVKISYIYPNLAIQGKVFITKAAIKLKNYISTISLPDETVFVGDAKIETPSILLATKLHLDVTLGDDIYLNYKDFETHLGGNLLIDQVPNSPATATGEIYTIKGEYTIYGQNLVIKTGRLIYAGNVLTNPGLTIEAIRTVKSMNSAGSALLQSLESYAGADSTVGVRVTGTAENPSVTLFSNPAGMTQAQILSALGGGGAALMSAVAALNPGATQMDGMTTKFTKMLGLSEANISSVQTLNPATSQMESTPSLVVGKRISKKLSLHYSIGIFNPISIFNVRYQLNKNWAIQSETSTIENGADVLYGFETS